MLPSYTRRRYSRVYFRGRGVIVHKSDCKNIIGIDKSRLINVSWKEGAGRQNLSAAEFFETKIRIITDDKKGILGDIASLISAKGAIYPKLK
jgi:Guanosine polyphosphate pyrophosphohydrolases/synthetases